MSQSIDDYGADKVERNDRSFIFVLDVVGATPHQLKLYPAAVRMCQASLAPETEAKQIVRQMRCRCLKLGTKAQWNAGERCLEINLADTVLAGSDRAAELVCR